jgi:transposase
VAAASHGELQRQLAYKSRAFGTRYIEVPSKNSTRTCSNCEALTGPTGWDMMTVRHWKCSGCGTKHDRDINAAVNTLILGQELASNIKELCHVG